MLPDAVRRWSPLALLLLLAGAGVLWALERAESSEQRERARAAEEIAAAREDSLLDRDSTIQRLRSESDSLSARADSIREEETEAQRRIDELLAELGERAAADSIALAEARGRDDELLLYLREAVRPELRDSVVAAIRADSIEESNADRLVAGLRRRAELLEDRVASVERELDAEIEARLGAEADADSLAAGWEAAKGVIEDKNEAIAEWRAAAEPDLIASFFGSSIVETAANLGVGYLAWREAEETGVAIWAGTNAVRIVSAGR